MTQDWGAIEVTKTREYVAQRLRLLTFPEWIQKLVSRRAISVSVAEAIASRPPEIQNELPSMIQKGREPAAKHVHEFAQASIQVKKSTSTGGLLKGSATR